MDASFVPPFLHVMHNAENAYYPPTDAKFDYTNTSHVRDNSSLSPVQPISPVVEPPPGLSHSPQDGKE